MLARVFLVDVPPAFSLLKMRGWLDRFSISSISSVSSDDGTCIQIETSARAEADKIACVLDPYISATVPSTLYEATLKSTLASCVPFPVR